VHAQVTTWLSESHQTMASSTQYTPKQLQDKFDLGITLILSSWEALTLAVQNQWGGPDSNDKREWFAGAISDLFVSDPDIEPESLEDVLLQVMGDEFEVAVEDGSEIGVAAALLKIKSEIAACDFSTLDMMWQKYKSKKPVVKAQRVGPSSDDEESVDDESDPDDDDGMEVDELQSESIQARPPKPEPEIDEDGFTKVVRRRK